MALTEDGNLRAGTAAEEQSTHEVLSQEKMRAIRLIPAPYLTKGWRAQKGPHPDNKSGFRATLFRVLLKPDEVEEKSAGGIVFVPKTVNAEKNIAVEATVVEIGLDAWADKSADACEVGDRVLVGQYVGKFHTSPVDGKEYRFVSDLDIISPLPKV